MLQQHPRPDCHTPCHCVPLFTLSPSELQYTSPLSQQLDELHNHLRFYQYVNYAIKLNCVSRRGHRIHHTTCLFWLNVICYKKGCKHIICRTLYGCHFEMKRKYFVLHLRHSVLGVPNHTAGFCSVEMNELRNLVHLIPSPIYFDLQIIQ